MDKLLHRLKTHYVNLPIKYKLFYFHFLMVLILCLTSLAAIQIALNIHQEIICQEAVKVLNFATKSIEDELRQIEKYAYNIIINAELQDTLEKLKNGLSVYERGVLGKELTDRLWEWRFERNISSVNLIDCNGNQYAGGDQIPHELAMGIVSQVAVEEGSMAFLEPVGGNPSIIGARTIRKVRELSLAPLGTLIIRVDIEKIIQQLTYDTMENHKYLLITSGEKTVYSSFPDLDVSEGLADDKENGGYQVVKVDGKSYFVVFNKSPFTNWLYTNILPYEDVFKQVIQMRRIVILIFGALFLITMLISLWMAGNLTKPMQKLINQMKLVESGEFEETMAQSLELERGDEIGTLQRKFLKMVQRIKNLIQENYTKQLLVKEAQLRALQAQINPHFLYNALESINWRAKINQQTEISQMIESLGNLLRNAMSDQQHLVTVNEELKLIQDYIHIQKVRFGSRLDFKIELDRRWEQLLIPKLILQPLVENAINHGLEQMIEPCTIRITATESGAFLFLKVEDNGPGIPPDLLRKLQMQETKPDNLGIGLKNIDERLKLVYGKEYGLTLTSQVGAGTRVMVKIPKEKVENV